MNIKVYQIDLDRDKKKVAFLPYSGIPRENGKEGIDSSIYRKQFEGQVSTDDLEDVFEMFNRGVPAGHSGRSMSVSDVVEVTDSRENEPGFYYCDSIGFRKVDFDAKMVLTPERDLMTVVMVEPGKEAYVTEIGRRLEDMQRAVDGYIETFYPGPDDEAVFICNEDGKLDGHRPNRAVYSKDGEMTDIIFGPFFICGSDGERFASLPENLREKYTEMYRLPERFTRDFAGAIKAERYMPCRNKEETARV